MKRNMRIYDEALAPGIEDARSREKWIAAAINGEPPPPLPSSLAGAASMHSSAPNPLQADSAMQGGALVVDDNDEEGKGGEEEENGGSAAAAVTGTVKAWNQLPYPTQGVDHVRLQHNRGVGDAFDTGVKGLTEAEINAAAHLLLPRTPSGRLIEPPGWDKKAIVASVDGRCNVTHSTLQMLSDGGWLSDDIVNCEIARLQRGVHKQQSARGRTSSSSSSAGGVSKGHNVACPPPNAPLFDAQGAIPGRGVSDPSKVWVTNSFFFKRLCSSSGAGGYDFSGVSLWPTRAGVHLSSLEAVIVPINTLHPDHWALCALDLGHKRAHYWDSWFRKDKAEAYEGRLRTLVRWAGDESHRADSSISAQLFAQGWELKVHSLAEGTPQQFNDYDCGAFFLLCFAKGCTTQARPRRVSHHTLHPRKQTNRCFHALFHSIPAGGQEVCAPERAQVLQA